nr:hypothetical protein [Tanacetum cinerariifolium]
MERFNDLLRACPHHGFSELHQLDTFYNALNINDQDSLNSAAGGNFLEKMPRKCLKIIESKSKHCFLDKKNQSPALTPSTTPALVKAVEPNCVTCGATHSYQNCPATYENAYRDNIQEYVSQAAATSYNQRNTDFRPQMVANQIRPPGFPPHQNNQNNFNRGTTLIKTEVEISTHLLSIKANFIDLRSGTLPGNTITNPKEDLKGITTRSGVAYQGPKTPSPSKQGTKVTKDQVQTPSSQNTALVQPSVIQSEYQAPVFEPVVAPFPADFVVVNFEPDPRVPLILGRCFLKTGRALIDVHKGELNLRIGKEASTYNLDQTVSEPLPPFPNHEQYLPSYKKELKVCEAKTIKPSVDEPPEVELKELPPHLEYVFLEGDDKFPVIIAKELGEEEKSALIKVLKSYKRAIAWKLSDIQG